MRGEARRSVATQMDAGGEAEKDAVPSFLPSSLPCSALVLEAVNWLSAPRLRACDATRHKRASVCTLLAVSQTKGAPITKSLPPLGHGDQLR